MAEQSSLLKEIVKAKENIKRKYQLLKSGNANVQSLITQTFKPIIEPLNKISNANDVYVGQKKNYQFNNNISKLKHKSDEIEKNVEDTHQLRIENWFKSLDFDKTYGPKKLSNGDITLGNKVVNFTQHTLHIEDVEYPLTPGLVRLIFLKHSTQFTEYDLSVYKKILIQTSAHLILDGSKIKVGGDKYKNIITKLFPTGEGLSVKLQKHQLVYWNDPNELVDRLRLLLASKAAGNTGVSNEILSIFEELYEARIIKRIPNV